jgi:hypothetical protein
MTRKELMRVMPANGDDLPAANRIVETGHPTVVPVMRDMVRWMRVAQSPVADTFAQFFGALGAPAVNVIAEGLLRENCWLRHRVFSQILPKWPPEVIRQLTNVLTVIATQPDAYDNDLRSVAVLTKYRLADPEWLKEWITFKKEGMAARHQLLLEVEEQLKQV